MRLLSRSAKLSPPGFSSGVTLEAQPKAPVAGAYSPVRGRKIPLSTAVHPCDWVCVPARGAGIYAVAIVASIADGHEKDWSGGNFPRGAFFEGAPHPNDCDVIAGADTGANRVQCARGESSACFRKRDRREPRDLPFLTHANCFTYRAVRARARRYHHQTTQAAIHAGQAAVRVNACISVIASHKVPGCSDSR